MAKDLLLSPEEFLKSGIHIGTKYKTNGMKKYIYNQRKDGLKVLAIETISDRIKDVAKIVADYDLSRVAVIGRRLFSQAAVEKFAEVVGSKAYTGRFVPGTFTNVSAKEFFEPELIIIAESNLDKQAVEEAKELDIPVIAFSSTNNFTENIDYVVPANNKGKKSLATLYWLLAREVQLEKGIIKTRSEFNHRTDEFESKVKIKRKPFKNKRSFGPRRFRRN